MPQFAVHKNTNVATKAAVPFLLDVHSDLVPSLAQGLLYLLHGYRHERKNFQNPHANV